MSIGNRGASFLFLTLWLEQVVSLVLFCYSIERLLLSGFCLSFLQCGALLTKKLCLFFLICSIFLQMISVQFFIAYVIDVVASRKLFFILDSSLKFVFFLMFVVNCRICQVAPLFVAFCQGERTLLYGSAGIYDVTDFKNC
jgi:hypothetical protein